MESAYQTNFPTYTYSINIKEDLDWKAYLEFLYPTEQTYEYRNNEKVIMHLTKQGDDLSKARQTHHWLYFKTDADRNKFINYWPKENFKIESKKLIKDAALKYQLQISRVDKVNLRSISNITIVRRKKAKALNGNYDGWETFVVQ